ncbi:MAG: oxygenase MpaB family protein [Actinomycetota bacterium]
MSNLPPGLEFSIGEVSVLSPYDDSFVENAEEHPPDTGLFGPSSLTWRLHADSMMGLAVLRAMLLQALHPIATPRVYQSAIFPGDIWQRCTQTADYIGAVTYGSTGEAMAYGARARSIHSSLTTIDARTGTKYAMDDPRLLAWIHVCFVDSVLAVLRRSGVPLSDRQADLYLMEQTRGAALLGLEPDDTPASRVALIRYFRVMRSELAATEDAREEAKSILEPSLPRHHALARPAWSKVAGLAFAALPTWARRLYAMPRSLGVATLHGVGTTMALHVTRASLHGQVITPRQRSPFLGFEDSPGRP